uniref:Ty3 transposon capsid-like protein domain-containing protein n=1 Tax=Ananas comosus var. bracteatus TaxID=296719 RepID=A0A6V7NGP0_ANACO|nr:unnamed protein product [Ananas comosus var. bracteatus]
MAEGTRLRVLDEHVQSLEQQLQELATRNSKKFEELYHKMEVMRVEEQNHYEALRRDSATTSKKLEQLMELIANQQHATTSRGTSGSITQEVRGILPTPNPLTREDNSSYQMHSRINLQLPIPRLDFPYFNGDNPRSWVRRCEKYFEIYGIKEHQRLELATMHMEPKVDTWFHGLVAEKGVVSWETFALDVCKRFDSNGLTDVVEEFNKLTQQGIVEEYQEQFEDLRSRLLHTSSQFAREYFLSSFLSGLKEEIKSASQSGEPLTSNYMGNNSATSTRGVDTTKNYFNRAGAERAQPNRRLWEQRRAAGLCFKCGDKYSFGHQCKQLAVNAMSATSEVTEVYDEECLKEVTELEELADEEEREIGLSLHALSAENLQETIKIQEK